ncbi:hypothetical protein BDR04DRAFT_1121969 [Suillus decipiens]|nr:hypothetical protein BDR04DRAFT_1121969 [Suillus decipiens]
MTTLSMTLRMVMALGMVMALLMTLKMVVALHVAFKIMKTLKVLFTILHTTIMRLYMTLAMTFTVLIILTPEGTPKNLCMALTMTLFTLMMHSTTKILIMVHLKTFMHPVIFAYKLTCVQFSCANMPTQANTVLELTQAMVMKVDTGPNAMASMSAVGGGNYHEDGYPQGPGKRFQDLRWDEAAHLDYGCDAIP